MIQDFVDAASNISNQWVQACQTNGQRIVGYTCSYVPEEILYAANIQSVRLRGVEAKATTIGDTYFGPFICSFPKCLLQLVGEGKYNFLDGVILTPGCDSMRRLDECWRKSAVDYSGVLPDFFFHYAVPHKVTEYSLAWFTEETRRLLQALQDHFRVIITDEKLHQAIKLYNHTRDLLARLEALRIREKPVIPGHQALAVLLARTTMPVEVYCQKLGELLDKLEQQAPDPTLQKRKKLMLVGSVNDDLELVRAIEGDSAIVVQDNLCFGNRLLSDQVEQTDDPVQALAKRYLTNSDCPRMFGDYKNRLAILRDKIQRAQVDGVILQNIRFCDLHGSENGLFEKALEAEGIRCIRLEREYGPLIERGRIKMRIDAFLERIA